MGTRQSHSGQEGQELVGNLGCPAGKLCESPRLSLGRRPAFRCESVRANPQHSGHSAVHVSFIFELCPQTVSSFSRCTYLLAVTLETLLGTSKDKGQHLPSNSLCRDLVRRREAMPQDIAQVESAGTAHQDFQHVHLVT